MCVTTAPAIGSLRAIPSRRHSARAAGPAAEWRGHRVTKAAHHQRLTARWQTPRTRRGAVPATRARRRRQGAAAVPRQGAQHPRVVGGDRRSGRCRGTIVLATSRSRHRSARRTPTRFGRSRRPGAPVRVRAGPLGAWRLLRSRVRRRRVGPRTRARDVVDERSQQQRVPGVRTGQSEPGGHDRSAALTRDRLGPTRRWDAAEVLAVHRVTKRGRGHEPWRRHGSSVRARRPADIPRPRGMSSTPSRAPQEMHRHQPDRLRPPHRTPSTRAPVHP